MPSGVYQRKPYMQSAGKTRGQHEYIRDLRAQGATVTELARAFGVARSTIWHIERGDWNPGRGAAPAAIDAGGVIRAHGRTA